MRFATRTLLAALALVLTAGTASAQNDVTFQVDLSLCPDNVATDSVLVRGSINDWSNDPDGDGPLTPTYNLLTDDNSDGTYVGVVSLPEGDITYKFYGGTPETAGDTELDYEEGDNRTYTVVAGAQTIPVVAFNKSTCVANTIDIESVFTVDMNVAIDRGVFDKTTDKLYVAGALTGWGGAAGNADYELTEGTQDGIYTGLIQLMGAEPGKNSPFKYIIQETGSTDIGWESKPGGGDYQIAVPESPDDADSNGFFEVAVDRRFYGEVGFDQVLDAPATVTFRVDMRPAESFIAANAGGLPFEANGGSKAETQIDGVYMNGPALWEATANGGPSGGITDWVTWGADGLGSTASAAFTEDTNNPGFWEMTVEYPKGALRSLVGKLGVNGSDNEAAGGNDAFYPIEDGTTVNLVFGAMLKADGSFDDDGGPNNVASYDPYIMIDNTANPPTAMWVASGGESDILVSIEDGPSITGLAIGSAYPNPTHGPAALDLTLDRALDLKVALYDVVGRQVALLAEGPVAAGETTVEMDVADLSPGVYLLRVEADGQAVVRRMTVLR